MKSTPQLRTAAASLVIGLAIVAVYFEAPQGVRLFDDIPLLGFACNDSLTHFSLDSACGYRPVRHLSFAIEGSLWGIDNDVAHHVVNIGLHVLASLAFFGLLRRLLGPASTLAALIGALVFAAHPVQVDAVAYISGRRDVLCGLFYIGAFWLAVVGLDRGGARRASLLAASGLLWALALGSKEMAVTLPAVVLWYEFSVRVPQETRAPSIAERASWLLRHRLLVLAPAGLAAIAFAVYRGFLSSKSHLVLQGEWWGGTFWTNLMTGVSLQRYFAEVALIPLRLPGDWSPPMVQPVESALNTEFWIGLAISLSLVVGIGAALRRQRNLLAFGLGWYLLSVLPVSQIIPHHEIFAEHYVYIPLVGLAIAGASVLHGFLDRPDGAARKALVGAACTLLLLLGLRAHSHVADYRNPLTLAHATLRWAPDHPRALMRAASWLIERKRWDDAEGYLVAMLDTTASDKLRRLAYQKLAFRYLETGRWDRLAAVADKARADFPEDPTFLGLKGRVLIRQGRTERGFEMLDRAAQSDSAAADIKFLAAMEHRKRGNFPRAIAYLRAAITRAKRAPEARHRYQLALAHLLLRQQPAESLRLAQAVLEESPESPGARQLAEAARSQLAREAEAAPSDTNDESPDQ